MRFNLGQQVIVNAILERTNYVWKRKELDTSIKGIVVGYRNRNDGTMETDWDEWSGKSYKYYVAKKGFATALVAYNLDRLPLVVLPNDVRKR